jgi:hypothetical protein
MYNKFRKYDELPWGRGLLDVILSLVAGLVLIIIIILIWVNDPKEEAEKQLPPPGNVIVHIEWAKNIPYDIDLWVKGPLDQFPVGFSSKNGTYFNLLRDDLGHNIDASGMNYEDAISRGFEPGEYVVNVHWFGYRTSPSEALPPIEINVVISVSIPNSQGGRQNSEILSSKITLTTPWEEQNVAVFKILPTGYLDRDSVYRDSLLKIKNAPAQEN